MKKKKPRIIKQKVKSTPVRGVKATLNGEPLEVISYIANGVLFIVNALASVSTPVTYMEDTTVTEDADFEIIKPKQITNGKH